MKLARISDLLSGVRSGFACGANPVDGVLQFRMNNVARDGSVDLTKTRRVPVTTKNLDDFYLADGDVLFNATNSPELVGKTAFISALPEPAVFSNHFLRLRPDVSQIDGRYLSLWLQKRFAERAFQGMCRQWVGQATVNRDELLAMELPVPPLSEQRRIAAILDQAATLRAQRRAAIAQLDSLGQAVFLEMFGDTLSNTQSWATESVESVCELIVDCVNRTAPLADHITPYKMIRTTNVKAGKVDLTSVRYVTAETFSVWNRRAVPQHGDVLLTREAPVGEVGILEGNEHVFLGQRLMLYRPRPLRATAEYLLYSFLSPYLQRQFDRFGSGSTVKHLPLPACRAFEVRVPPYALQQLFAQRIQAIGRLNGAHHAAASHLDELFASLQHRAFRGELTALETAPRKAVASRTVDFEGLRKLELDAGLEALIFVINRRPDRDLYASLKTLYVADKMHLEKHGQLIYGETYNALPMGPVPEAAYLAVKVLRNEEMFSPFDDAATQAAIKVQGKQLIPLRDADLSKLDSAAIQSLESAIRYFAGATFGEIKVTTHDAAYLRTQPNAPIPMQYLIDMLPAKVRQQHWVDEASGFSKA